MTTTRYFAVRGKTRRELSATSIGEAFTLLQAGEILSSVHILSVDEQIRAHSRTVIQYRSLHRSTLGEIHRRRVQGTLKPRLLVMLLSDAAAYRRMFASHRIALRRVLDCALVDSCPERSCVECRVGAA